MSHANSIFCFLFLIAVTLSGISSAATVYSGISSAVAASSKVVSATTASSAASSATTSSKVASAATASLIKISAVSHTAVPLADIQRAVTKAHFTYKEHGLVFGSFSIESCLHVSDQIAVLENYCYPKKNYIARGFTLISPAFGVVHFYEENLRTAHKRDIVIRSFPEELAKILRRPMGEASIANLNLIFEILSNQPTPACWSTNFNFNTKQPESACYNEDIANFTDWSSETSIYTRDPQLWDQLMSTISRSVKNSR